MRRELLAGKWLALHITVVAASIAFVFLGRWQWHRAFSPDGPPQSLFYAIQWWSFILLAGYGWFRLVREEIRDPQDPTAAREVLSTPVPAVPEQSEDADQDAELAAYNRYLAELNARTQARPRR